MIRNRDAVTEDRPRWGYGYSSYRQQKNWCRILVHFCKGARPDRAQRIAIAYNEECV